MENGKTFSLGLFYLVLVKVLQLFHKEWEEEVSESKTTYFKVGKSLIAVDLFEGTNFSHLTFLILHDKSGEVALLSGCGNNERSSGEPECSTYNPYYERLN